MSALHRRQATIIVHHTRIAALALDDSPEAFKALAGIDRASDASGGVGPARGYSSEDQHSSRQLDGNGDHVLGTSSLQHLETLDDFERVAHGAP